jgi:hypothetical protein
MKSKYKNLFLVTLCEQNGDYEYERTGLIKADKDANDEAEQIASQWYSERGEPCGNGFSFHQGGIRVAVSEVKKVQSEESAVLLRYLPLWN